MFVSMNLQVTTKNINNDMLEYDVYNSKHSYYMTERFELCVLTQRKYISNHFDPLHIINHVAMHLLQIKETEEQLQEELNRLKEEDNERELVVFKTEEFESYHY